MKKTFPIVLAAAFLLSARLEAQPALKDAFKQDFLIGAALNSSQVDPSREDSEEVALIKRQFNSITPENVLKWGSIHPRPDRYDFAPADNYVDFGVKYNMFIIGHNLIWHNQTPAWVFKDDKGEPMTRDALIQRMHDHIFAVVGRYKGKIKGWDVVNEALAEDGSLRKTSWLKIIGEDYLVKAYQFAHEADPDAQLYYNEYSMENPDKRAGAISLVKKLQAAGVPLYGVGMQGHYKLDWPAIDAVDQTINELSALGVKVMITELDVDVLPAATRSFGAEASLNVQGRASMNPYTNGLPDSVQEALARRYADLFAEFVKHRDQISRVTFWGVEDGGSWLNDWPVRGRTDYPLLFDRQGRAKPAFDSVISVGTGVTNAPRRLGAMNNAANEADHKKMLEMLHIDSIRRGRDNNKKSANYANYDEAKANPFPDLPDPLVSKDGRKATTPEMWWNLRRPEIVEDFDREIYGRMPKDTPKVTWEVTNTSTETNGAYSVTVKKLAGRVDNSIDPDISVTIQLTLATPAHATGPVPVMMQLMFANFPRPAGANAARRASLPASVNAWQQQVLAMGWGYATIIPTSIQPDNGAGLTSGIIGLMNKGQSRKPDDWGALRAWGWGASRALDYFETDPAVDAKHVGLEGHSRYGKATLVAMADDSRFAICYVSSSGEGGAKLHRRDFGEVVENVAAAGEYHWMAGNFIKYAGPLHWNDLPVDSHELIALCAPRPIFIGAGTTEGDGWADGRGSFMAAAAAGPVYELLGKKSMGTDTFPPIETPLIDGDVAFRQHSGGHTDAPNWETFLKFASRYIKSAF
ncbi:MAG TPA: endo-1,4-beta-xylanase [Verrucomicrobiae bacterium]|jgi:GH35 family endo-1,4-beta-xylanase